MQQGHERTNVKDSFYDLKDTRQLVQYLLPNCDIWFPYSMVNAVIMQLDRQYPDISITKVQPLSNVYQVRWQQVCFMFIKVHLCWYIYDLKLKTFDLNTKYFHTLEVCFHVSWSYHKICNIFTGYTVYKFKTASTGLCMNVNCSDCTKAFASAHPPPPLPPSPPPC